MSSRALRRLEREKLEKKRANLTDNESEDDDVPQAPQSRTLNAFAFLDEEEESEEEEEEEEEDDEELNGVDIIEEELEPESEDYVSGEDDDFVDAEEGDSEPEPEPEVVQKVSVPSKKSKKNKSKSKSKNKKKNKNKKTQQQMKKVDDLDDDELDKLLSQVAKENQSNDSRADTNDEEQDEIDSVFDNITEPMETYAPGGKVFTLKKFQKCLPLLQVNPNDLDPDKEYESLFGKLSSAAIEEADSTSSTFVTPEILKQIKQLSKRVRGWSGRDHRSIPGTSRKLKLTKIRDDWIPSVQKSLVMEQMTDSQLQAYFELTTDDWKDVIASDVARLAKAGVRYYQMGEGPLYTRAVTTQFFISTVVAPDHESLIQLMQKSPYHLETLLQVASILQRQGDNSNTNGLIERALFVFDWSFKSTFNLGSGVCRLPFEFFLNRQVYLTLFRYITVLTQKSTFFTAFNYCKLLLSFDPTDDPYGVRYFIDFYAFMAGEYQYLIDFVNSSLVQCYKEWFTPSLAYTSALCHFKLGNAEKAKSALKKAFEAHPYTGYLFLSKLNNGVTWKHGKVSTAVELSTAVYVVRANILCEEQDVKQFVTSELMKIINENPKLKKSHLDSLKEAPFNLMRHVILSNETSAMARIPESFWKKHEVCHDK
ncbi:unnamed protein product [Ambrosiozyma monospora]|uniref:Unnamed protein product n=1 Tax=Ambrosiozyma monospora TaxID=43982 RepID=A0A9W6YV78_AMBMO|nr:unnamed protein product [Ambrosiozyma monospora]